MSVVNSKSWLPFNILCAAYGNMNTLGAFHEEFLSRGYVKLPGLFLPEVFSQLNQIVAEMKNVAQSRSFTMPGFETPRILSTIGGQKITHSFPIWANLYSHHEIVKLVSALSGEGVYACQHGDEHIVANFLSRRGGTHGWHLDDPAYALVLFFASPASDVGGLLEFIPEWRKHCCRMSVDPEIEIEPAVRLARDMKLIETRHHLVGDAYFLRADKCLHRVTELNEEGAERAVINMAYQDIPFQVYGQTATVLYSEGGAMVTV